MDEVAGNAVLDTWELCQEAKAAYEQFRHRGRQCLPELKKSLVRLDDAVSDATAKGVPEVMTQKILSELPDDARSILQRIKRELQRTR